MYVCTFYVCMYDIRESACPAALLSFSLSFIAEVHVDDSADVGADPSNPAYRSSAVKQVC